MIGAGYNDNATSSFLASIVFSFCLFPLPAAQAELREDVKRLWLRNLGRDDRITSDHGRELRTPFLAEGVMVVLLRTPLHLLSDPRRQGCDKQVLRDAARVLQMHAAAKRPKRAIQFGCRIARAVNQRDFGSGRAANAVSAGSRLIRPIPPKS